MVIQSQLFPENQFPSGSVLGPPLSSPRPPKNPEDFCRAQRNVSVAEIWHQAEVAYSLSLPIPDSSSSMEQKP